MNLFGICLLFIIIYCLIGIGLHIIIGYCAPEKYKKQINSLAMIYFLVFFWPILISTFFKKEH